MEIFARNNQADDLPCEKYTQNGRIARIKGSEIRGFIWRGVRREALEQILFLVGIDRLKYF
jgi:hypothetical protein